MEIEVTDSFFKIIIFAFLKLCFNLPVIYYPENKEEGLLEKRRQLSRDISRLKETYEALLARFPNIQFAYR